MATNALEGGGKLLEWSHVDSAEQEHQAAKTEVAPEAHGAVLQTGESVVKNSDFVRLSPAAEPPKPIEVFTHVLGRPQTVEAFDRQMTEAVRAAVNAGLDGLGRRRGGSLPHSPGSSRDQGVYLSIPF